MRKDAVKTAQSLLAQNLKATGDPTDRSFWTLRNTVMLIVALAYIISPFDALPDWLIFIGWLDDLGVITALFFWWRNRRKKIASVCRDESEVR